MRTCSYGNCGRPHRARGMCSTHYHRWWREQDEGEQGRTECVHNGCGTVPMGGGKWCYWHWRMAVVELPWRRSVVRCGTPEGRERHWNRREPPCVACERLDWSWIDVMLAAA